MVGAFYGKKLLKNQGFTLAEMAVGIGILSVGIMAMFTSVGQVNKVRGRQDLGFYADLLARETGREISKEASCTNNFVGRTITPSSPISFNQLVTRTGSPLLRTAASGTKYYQGVEVNSIVAEVVEQFSPTEFRVHLILEFEKRGMTIKKYIEGRIFVDASNQITDCRMIGSDEIAIEEVCNSIEGATYDPVTGKCKVSPPSNANYLGRFGDLGDKGSRVSVTECPEGSRMSGLWVNGNNRFIMAARAVCRKIDQDGRPTGPGFLSQIAGQMWTGMWAWESGSNCPNDKWAIGYTFHVNYNIDSGYSHPWENHAYKRVRMRCGDVEHTSTTQAHWALAPWQNYLDPGGLAQKMENRTCQPGSTLRKLMLGSQFGRSNLNNGAGINDGVYFNFVEGQCN